MCSGLNCFAVSNYLNGDYIIITRSGSSCKKILGSSIPGFGDTTRVVNNANGSYTHYNENQVSKTFGYMLNCINDTMLALTDWDGTVIGDTCVIGTGSGGGGGGFDCSDVEDCLTMDGVLCDALNTFGSGTFGAGDKLVGIESNGTCVLYTDIQGVGDTCRVVNNANASYTHTNENGTQVIFGYKMLCINDSMLTITDWDGTPVGDTCTILGGGMTETDICETINGLPSADSQLGDKYVTINSEGECVLTDSIKIDICGIIQEIQEESDLAEGDVFFIQRGINCFKVPWGLLSTDCIALTMEAGDLRADIITDPSPPSPYKKVYCGENGLYADSTTVDCEQLRNLFPSGSFESNDHILSFDGNTDNCEWVSLSTLGVNCANVSALFVPATPTTNDSILVSAGGNCRKVRAESYSICSQTLTHWELGSCEQPQIVVKCGSECRYMTPCDIQTYVCAMMAPDIEKMIDDKFKDYPKFNPFKLGNSEANLPYPTVTNSGIKTVKNKIEALKDKNIPIGGLYYIAGGEEIKVKNKQL